MSEETLFFIDSASAKNGTGDHGAGKIAFEKHGPDSTDASPAMTESFISVEKDVSPHLVVGGGKNQAVDSKSRKLQHNLNVKHQIYFGADINSLLSHSSKNRIRGSGNGATASSSSSVASSSAATLSKADQLVASLLDDSSSAAKDSRLGQAMAKSVITNDFGRREAVPSSQQSRRERKKAHAAAKESSTGAKWFHMKRAEMTEEEKRDLKILKMRKALDPKTFYKGDDMKGLPRFFQKGTVVESKAEFYSSRIPKKQRKQTLAEELLADAKFVDYGTAKMEERKKFDEDRKKRMRQKKHLQRMTAKKKGKK